MSKKSRKQREVRQARKTAGAPVLSRQQATVNGALRDYMWAAVLFLVMTLGVLAIGLSASDPAHRNGVLWGAVPLTALIAAGYGYGCARRGLLRHRLRRISCEDACPQVFHCRSIRLLYHPVSKHRQEIIGLILKDEAGKKYIYIYPEGEEKSQVCAAPLRKQFRGAGVTVECYRDSNFVKTIPELPEDIML